MHFFPLVFLKNGSHYSYTYKLESPGATILWALCQSKYYTASYNMHGGECSRTTSCLKLPFILISYGKVVTIVETLQWVCLQNCWNTPDRWINSFDMFKTKVVIYKWIRQSNQIKRISLKFICGSLLMWRFFVWGFLCGEFA